MTDLRPSNATFWVNCPGWLSFINKTPNLSDENTAANDGVNAHEMAARVLKGEAVEGDDELKTYIGLYYDTITGSTGEIVSENIEKKMLIDRGLEIKGTPDYWGLEKKTLSIFDFKYGHKHIPVIENPQLLLYALGLYNNFVGTINKFNFYIIQPRDYHNAPVRKWSISIEDFHEHIDPIIKAARIAKLGGDLKAGKHCLYCKARHLCPALNEASSEVFDFISQPIQTEIGLDKLGEELNVLKYFSEIIKAKQTGLEAQITELINQGKHVPGYRLKPGRGNLSWDLPPEQIIAFGKIAGIDLNKPTTITPTQAKKLGLDPVVVEQLTGRPKTGLKLVPDDVKNAEEIFGK